MEDDAPTRSVDIQLNSELVTIDLDNLDPDPADVLDLLTESHAQTSAWTRLVAEYWKQGFLEASEKMARAAIADAESQGNERSLPPIYTLLANLQVAQARAAPKFILRDATADILSDVKIKDDFHTEAANSLNKAQETDTNAELNPTLNFLTRGIQQLATRSMDDALRSFESVLMSKPTNVIALMGKGRILYARRNYIQALTTFQHVLRLSPSCRPDPRVGIGLCLWALGKHSKAKDAWERSLEVNPTWSTRVLLAIAFLNESKKDGLTASQLQEAYTSGFRHIERAWKESKHTSAAAANILSELTLQKGQTERATKLAERTIQFADTLTLVTEGYVHAGRLSQMAGKFAPALKHYQAAMDGQKKNIIANIGHALLKIDLGDYTGAIHTLDTLTNAIKPQECIEATAILASLKSITRVELSAADNDKERLKARELYERVLRALEGQPKSKISKVISEDMEMFVEIASLWQRENLEKAGAALQRATKIAQNSGTSAEVRLLNNYGVVRQLGQYYEEARNYFETALTVSAGLPNEDDSNTTILYNLARAYEELKEEDLAKDAYAKLLNRHPEYVDAKVRQAHMLDEVRKGNEAHDLLKQALSANGSNLNLRAYYTYFLIHSHHNKPAKDFVFGTLKEHDKHDVYSLCAAGLILYQQARESRESSSKGQEERKQNFRRSAEFYEKALYLDPSCAFAAQGLAILTAEDAMGDGKSGPQMAQRNARDALDVFSKVRESMHDGNVYFNIGHCHYASDDYDRAIENYETASRFFEGLNVSVLLCLCRSWYAKGMKDQSYKAMQTALGYGQKALRLTPNDKAIVYNIAMIQQKAAEMMFTLDVTKRKLADLKHVIDQAAHAQKLFASLASDKGQTPYSTDIADQRRKYGENMLRKGQEHLAAQRTHEEKDEQKRSAAREHLRAEQERRAAEEHERSEAERRAQIDLADKRRAETARNLAWLQARAQLDLSDDEEKEKGKKGKRSKKEKPAPVSGDEEGGDKPSKRRRRLKRKNGNAVDAGEDEETTEKPAKRKRTKKVLRDDDDDEPAPADGSEHADGSVPPDVGLDAPPAPATKGRGGKVYKSKATISDSEDDEPMSPVKPEVDGEQRVDDAKMEEEEAEERVDDGPADMVDAPMEDVRAEKEE
ncbi:TPR-like protein [Cylindrobasidium torrendii FP15055 ss-10]|uniref:TPR-like protein n=1 Tax=Cylindrobasidium torrendii FP15055 ss-10 TaxID=1314674 RepID=A0A0D7BI03_9AGAR|nr:TPR-like protein [Cylindrobasidium torrendii FP15055 ss-10]